MKLVLLIICVLVNSSGPGKCNMFEFVGDAISSVGNVATEAFQSVTNVVDSVSNQTTEGVSPAIEDWIDLVMDTVPTALDNLGLSTLSLLPLELGLTPSILGAGIWASIFDASLAGINTLHRTGATVIEIDLPTASFLAKFDACINNATLNASMQISFIKPGPAVRISGTLGQVQGIIAIRLGVGLLGPYALLEVFEIQDNPEGYKLAELIFTVVKAPIINILETTLQDTFNQIFQNPPAAIPATPIKNHRNGAKSTSNAMANDC
ncbi:unnamed protein product [Allacma fusca]|uniref:Uncharacterized protein n=1 Tax=Allacma fusca TaxID=39272 RepID=A0A8J2Q2J5_9HEXA|nr:unnamed protein product [Allacma fusca]